MSDLTLARRKGLRTGATCTVDGAPVEGSRKGETEAGERPEEATDDVERDIRISFDAVVTL